MPWIILLFAALFEITWAIGLKYTEGLTRPVPTLLTVIALILSIVLLAQAARTLPIGTAYAVWTGVGTAGTVILGMVFMGDPVSAFRIGCVVLILAGVAGLRLA